MNSHTQDFVMPFFLNHTIPPLLRKSIFSDSKGLCLSQGDSPKEFTATLLRNASPRESWVTSCTLATEKEKECTRSISSITLNL